MISIREALELMLPAFDPLGSETRPLLDAHGRVLFGDLLARLDLPEFDNSAMDGYAVRHAELVAGGSLPTASEVRAGGPAPVPLAPATCARIFTGAALPAGADTVVIQENVERHGDQARFLELPAPGANVRARASDIRRGECILPGGSLIGPPEIGLLAAQG